MYKYFIHPLHACTQSNQLDPDNPKCSEDSAYPANPDSEYGWEKLLVSGFIYHMHEIMN